MWTPRLEELIVEMLADSAPRGWGSWRGPAAIAERVAAEEERAVAESEERFVGEARR